MLAFRDGNGVARRPFGRHQRLSQGAGGRGDLREGLPDVARDGADGCAPRLRGAGPHLGHLPQAGGLDRRQGGRRGARKHAGRLSSVLHRSPRDRSVPRTEKRSPCRAGETSRTTGSEPRWSRPSWISWTRTAVRNERLENERPERSIRERSSDRSQVHPGTIRQRPVWKDRHRGINVACGHLTMTTAYEAKSGRRWPCSG